MRKRDTSQAKGREFEPRLPLGIAKRAWLCSRLLAALYTFVEPPTLHLQKYINFLTLVWDERGSLKGKCVPLHRI